MNWIRRGTVIAIHDAQIAEHGGRPEIHDHAALDAALAHVASVRPRGRLSRLYHAGRAAAYACALSRSGAFLDGAERTALAVAETFLVVDGMTLKAASVELVELGLELAAGTLDEQTLADWILPRIDVAA